MKNKTKKILAVVVAVLFSLTIIGGIVISIIMPNNDTVTASADTDNGGISTYGVTTDITTNSSAQLTGCYYITIDPDDTFSEPLDWTSSGFLVAGYPCFRLRTALDADGHIRSIAVSRYIATSNQTTTTVIYDASLDNPWVSSSYRYWCFFCY